MSTTTITTTMTAAATAVTGLLLFTTASWWAMMRRRRRGSTRYGRLVGADGGEVMIGIDFGGTFMKIVRLTTSDRGEHITTSTLPVASSRNPGEIIDQIAAAIQELNGSSFDNIVALGVCCPGRVENGIVSTVANLNDWKDVPLAKLLKERTKVEKVIISNDAKAALAGEIWSRGGAAEGCKHVVMITLGTGVGGAVCSNGLILQGSTGMLGEVGHTIIVANGRSSEATQVKGIAEEYCSARGVKRTWMELSGESSSPDPKGILEQAQAKTDPLAVRVADVTFDYIGILIVNVCRAFDPECVILGGGMCATDWFVDECRKAAQRHQWTLAPPSYKLARAKHGNLSGAIGAASLALDRA